MAGWKVVCSDFVWAALTVDVAVVWKDGACSVDSTDEREEYMLVDSKVWR